MEHKSTQPELPLSIELLFKNEVVSVAHIALKGVNRRTINHGSTTTYSVLSGEGIMRIGDMEHTLAEGTTVVVPKGTPYMDEGNVEMVVTCIPPFDPASIEVLE
jgi:mannose-6-phosphate isomerase-like protein (cupin superfamily)